MRLASGSEPLDCPSLNGQLARLALQARDRQQRKAANTQRGFVVKNHHVVIRSGIDKLSQGNLASNAARETCLQLRGYHTNDKELPFIGIWRACACLLAGFCDYCDHG